MLKPSSFYRATVKLFICSSVPTPIVVSFSNCSELKTPDKFCQLKIFVPELLGVDTFLVAVGEGRLEI